MYVTENFDISGEVVKEDDRYVVKDNKVLNNLILSSTNLYPGKSTSGHSHIGQEEVYIFISGEGRMELGHLLDDAPLLYEVSAGSIITIPDGAFHRVHNTGNDDLYFICVFDGKRNH